MPTGKLLVVALLSVALIAGMALLNSMGILDFHTLTGMFIGYGQVRTETWWNNTWSYRQCVEIDSSSYNRTNWPVELEMNFSDLMPSGTLDENSLRLLEYYDYNLSEQKEFQFEKANDYNESTNALGTFVLLLNGTMDAGTNRTFCIYYDRVGHYDKPAISFDNMTYDFDTGAGIVNVNTTSLRVYIDKKRGDNLSGIFEVDRVSDGTGIVYAGSGARPAEYTEYWNGSDNLSFIADSMIVTSGPVRVTVKINGTEAVIGGSQTGNSYVEKYYFIYNRTGVEEKGGFLKTKTLLKNIYSSALNFSSPNSGLVSMDLGRVFPTGLDHSLTVVNTTNPRSYARAATEFENYFASIIHMNSSNGNFFASNNTLDYGRIGISLSETEISAGQSIHETALLYFGAFDDPGTEFNDILVRARNPEVIFTNGVERVHALTTPTTNASIYNRNETMIIRLNITSDPYNITEHVNSSISNGTASGADDFTIQLYDDGSHDDVDAGDNVFGNTYQIPVSANIAEWEINYTIYDVNGIVLDANTTKFNITDFYNANMSMITPNPIINHETIADITVRNYRNDTYVIGAQINCSVNSTPEINIVYVTELGNGNYRINFSAPSYIGDFQLLCNATMDGNTGNATANFYTEPSNTTISLQTQPTEVNVSGITMTQNQSFYLNVTANNTGNGTARFVLLYFNLSENWSAQPLSHSCGTLAKSTGCEYEFLIHVPANATPGLYNVTAMVNWTNPDDSNQTNQTIMNATVNQNPILAVQEAQVKKEVRDGLETYVGDFTVESLGNYNITNVNYSCTTGEVCSNFTLKFTPNNITSLANGATQKVAVNATVPKYYPYGSYLGTVLVNSSNGGSDTFTLNITVPSKAKLNASVNQSNYTSSNISLINNDTFSFMLNASNIGNGTAKNISFWLKIPTNWSANSTNETCDDLMNSEYCSNSFAINIPNNTAPGTYRINATINWTNPDSTQNFTTTYTEAIISQNPILNVTESELTGSVNGANSTNVANFSVWSIGNYNITGVNFSCESGIVCTNFTVSFSPANISTLKNGFNQTVLINVSVPSTTDAGNYTGIINITTGNDGYDTLQLNVTVPAIRTWNMTPMNCSHSESGGSGILCIVNITNAGNTQLTFAISPDSGNHTSINESGFSLAPRENKSVQVDFDINGTEERPLNATYLIDAVDADTYPDYLELLVKLIPTTEPAMNVSIVPDKISGSGYVEIYANVSDKSTTGISWVRANVTAPGNNITQLNFNNIGGNEWYVRYPQFGNVSTKGVYNVSVYAADNIGNTGNLNKTFKVYSFLRINATTLTDKYYQGDTSTIRYSLADSNNTGIGNASVLFSVRDNQSNLLYTSNLTTAFDGKIYPLPTFLIPSDALTGNYTLESNTSFFDENVNETIDDSREYVFSVSPRTVTVMGLFADITTAVVWYPDNTMKFSVIVYNGEGRPVDPDELNLTVFDPADNVYFTVNISDLERNSTGYYIYRYAMPVSTPTGMFVVIADAADGDFTTKNAAAFRVAKGGPYDVRIYPLETEVPQGSRLDFNMIIWNQGEVTQDVFLEYWVVSTTNVTYYSGSEAVLTPAGQNSTFTRYADIYSTQPTGMYYLVLKMNYDTVQAPIYANSTFIVTPKKENQTYYVDISVPSPPIQGTVFESAQNNETLPGIMLEKYSSEMKAARGYTRMESVTVRNSGRTTLKNITVYMTEVPGAWYTVSPAAYSSLAPGDSTTFIITFAVPRNVDIRSYNSTLHAVSGVITDEKPVKVTIFQSMEELLEDEIKTAKNRLVSLLFNMSEAERQGKDTSAPSLLIPQINTLIDGAESDLKLENLEQSMKKISDAKVLIDRAIDLLNNAPMKARAFEMPIWGWLLIILLAMGGTFAFVTIKRSKAGVRPYLTMLGGVAEAVRGKPMDRGQLIQERDKLVNVLNALEKQKAEGLISPQAYRNMKSEFESKLEKIKKQIG